MNLSDILVPTYRMRREFNEAKLRELADSIHEFGLQNPPVVRQTPDGPALVSGERRFRAISLLASEGKSFVCGPDTFPPGTLPVTQFSSLPELVALELELAENTIRVDLSIQEQIAAIEKLHILRTAQRGSQTATETAREIYGDKAAGSQISRVSLAVALAPHLSDPEVQKAKSLKEVEKIVRKKVVAQQRQELARAFDPTSSPHELLHGEAEVLLPLMPKESIAVFLTDPPYGVGADNFGSQATTAHQYKDDEESALARYDFFASEFMRLGKPDSHAYLFLDIRNFNAVKFMFEMAGWRVWPYPMIWAKNRGMLPWPEHGPRRMYEAILFAIKGDRRVNSIQGDVISVPAEREDHGAVKPVDLYVNLLSRSVLPGDTVLDACCGSGPIFPAASRLRCKAIGIEKVDAAHAISVERLKQLAELPT